MTHPQHIFLLLKNIPYTTIRNVVDGKINVPCHCLIFNTNCSLLPHLFTSLCLCFVQVFLGPWHRQRTWTVYFSSTWSSASTSRMKLSRTDWMTAGSIRAVAESTTWASIHRKCRSQQATTALSGFHRILSVVIFICLSLTLKVIWRMILSPS